MKPQAKPLHLAQIIALLFAAPAAFAADDTAPQQAKELETVIVKGERSRKPEQTVITDKDLQRAAAQNIDDSILYEPGVDVRSDNLQHGHSGYVIRGMGGNRIQMDIDGIPLPDSHEDLTGGPGASPETSVNRDTVETDTLKRISISKNANAAENGAGAAILRARRQSAAQIPRRNRQQGEETNRRGRATNPTATGRGGQAIIQLRRRLAGK